MEDDLEFIKIWERVSETLDAGVIVPARDVRSLAAYGRQMYLNLLASREELSKVRAKLLEFEHGQTTLGLQ